MPHSGEKLKLCLGYGFAILPYSELTLSVSLPILKEWEGS